MKRAMFITVSMAILTILGLTSCQQQPTNLPLADTEWHLVALDGAEVAVAEDTFNLKLSQEGFLSGVGACNRLLGKYEADDKGALRFVNVGSTMMLCPENGELEQQFLAALNATTHYAIEGNTLSLMAGEAVKAVMKGKSNEVVCSAECQRCTDCPQAADCPKKGNCVQHCCPKGKDCPQMESCEKRANCPKVADCPKKGNCVQHCCPKGKDCPQMETCDKRANCPQAADCPKKVDCPTKADCPKVADCPKKAECPTKADCPKVANCQRRANCPKAK